LFHKEVSHSKSPSSLKLQVIYDSVHNILTRVARWPVFYC